MVTEAPSTVGRTTYVTTEPDPMPEKPVRRVGIGQKLSKWDVKVSPYLYISPFFLSFAIFGIFPILYNVYVATQDFTNFRSGGQGFVGLENFRWVLGQARFWNALGNTFSIWLISAIPQLIMALFIAAVLDQNLRAKTFWRMAVLVPYVVLPIATSMIFAQIFGERGLLVPHLGPGGMFGEAGIFGTNPQGVFWNNPFFQNRIWSHVAIATMVNFRWTGYNALILLAAMQAVPRELYEAAVVDGASRVRQFFSVTLPSIRPTMIFVILTMTIGGLQVFDEVVMFDQTGGGGSDRQFETMVLYLFNLGFGNWNAQQLGRAAAVAWVFAIVILAVTLLNFFLTRMISSSSVKTSKATAGTYRRLVNERRTAYDQAVAERGNDWDPAYLNDPALAPSAGEAYLHTYADTNGYADGVSPSDYVAGETPSEFFEQHNADY